jgi:hypothetical protein
MLEEGRLEELKRALQDEIYQEELAKNPSAKKRYTAMKRYFTYHNSGREILQKPCGVDFEGEKYTCFTNSWSLALTKESTGEMELCSEPERYPNVSRIISFNGEEGTIDFADVFAKAAARGYKLKKSGFTSNDWLFHYDGTYFRLALLDATFRIVDDGESATVYHVKDSTRPMTIKTNIGICVVLPVRYDGNPVNAGNIVIDASEEEAVVICRDDITSLINRRRRQILVHSVIYYEFNENLISDSTWSKWAAELDELHKKYPEIARGCFMADAFSDFDPSSGFNLPLNDSWAVNKAKQLLNICIRMKGKNT